jgi:hypothetical protein
MNYTVAAILWIIMLLVYFFPTLIAVGREHHNSLAIFAVNLLFGWSVIGWFWAFIWSLTAIPSRKIARR